jgi:hypothetical protein
METVKNVGEAAKETLVDIKEVLAERLFSPMYFYFLIAWLITNWKFVYAFFSTDESFIFQAKNALKPEYLSSFYSWELYFPFLWSVLKLFVIPAISAFVVVWWLSILSTKFYEKNEQHKQNKRIINRRLEYQEKVVQAEEERKIRDVESDKPKIKYEDNEEFNNFYDDGKENIKNGKYEFLPSEDLYNNDYEAYKEDFEEWVNDAGEAYIEHLSEIRRGK